MDIFVTGIQAAYNFLVFYLYCRSFHHLLTPKKGKQSFRSMLSLVYLTLCITFITPAHAIALRELLLLAAILFSAYAFYMDPFLWSILASILLFLGIAFPEGIAMFILTYVFQLSTDYVMQELPYIWLPLMSVCTYFFLKLLCYLLTIGKNSITNYAHSAQWIFTLCVLNTIFLPAAMMIANYNQTLFLLYLITNCFSLYAFYKLFHLYRNYLLQKKLHVIAEQQYQECLDSYDECKKQLKFLRHDFVNQMQVLEIFQSEHKGES